MDSPLALLQKRGVPAALGIRIDDCESGCNSVLDVHDHAVREKWRPWRLVSERRAKLCVVEPMKGGDETLREPDDPTNERELRCEGLPRGVLVESAVVVDEE